MYVKFHYLPGAKGGNVIDPPPPVVLLSRIALDWLATVGTTPVNPICIDPPPPPSRSPAPRALKLVDMLICIEADGDGPATICVLRPRNSTL